MTANECKAVFEFEKSLEIGTLVLVCWTNCGYQYRSQGTVARINKKSVRVKLTQEVPCCYSEPYGVGREISVPFLTDIKKWSYRNRVEPVGGYQSVEKKNE